MWEQRSCGPARRGGVAVGAKVSRVGELKEMGWERGPSGEEKVEIMKDLKLLVMKKHWTVMMTTTTMMMMMTTS